MARAWFMSTASGFSIITGMWRWAHASTTLACEKVSVNVATASGFAVSSMALRSVKSRSLPTWFDAAYFASSAASGSQTATMTTSVGRLCTLCRKPQTWPWFSPAMAMRNGRASGGCALAEAAAIREAKTASDNRRVMVVFRSYLACDGWYTQSGRPQRTAGRKSDAWLTSQTGLPQILRPTERAGHRSCDLPAHRHRTLLHHCHDGTARPTHRNALAAHSRPAATR